MIGGYFHKNYFLFQLYEEHAFMRDPQLTNFLSHILEALEEISVPVDPALKETFEKHAFS